MYEEGMGACKANERPHQQPNNLPLAAGTLARSWPNASRSMCMGMNMPLGMTASSKKRCASREAIQSKMTTQY